MNKEIISKEFIEGNNSNTCETTENRSELMNNYSNLIRLKLIKDIPAAEALNTYSLHKNFLQNMGLDWDSDHLIIDLV
ncbi:unnamed protein product [Medioppia subpectinata]|uniref:Uncharacterized protein n=1 Tax=Medioppia subpectinata TaxID=1979941 RepID=A0A7R9LFF2_9ACAR|nr:unnamed protein product [Medioppia subpectinata]CAG2117851.1 unnamed protein product [Medioppia subpectinata]